MNSSFITSGTGLLAGQDIVKMFQSLSKPLDKRACLGRFGTLTISERAQETVSEYNVQLKCLVINRVD